MTAEGTFPKIDGDILYGSEVNLFYYAAAALNNQFILGTDKISGYSGTAPDWNLNAAADFNGYETNGTTSGHYFEYSIFLIAGTYTIVTYYFQATSAGIVTLAIDGATWATVDMYDASPTNQIDTTTGVAVATTGLHTIRVNSTTKHASSSAYRRLISGFFFTKTA